MRWGAKFKHDELILHFHTVEMIDFFFLILFLMVGFLFSLYFATSGNVYVLCIRLLNIIQCATER